MPMNAFTWHVGTDGNVYTGELKGERVATVEHGSEELSKAAGMVPDSDGHYPSLKPCRARLIAAAPDLLAACEEAMLHCNLNTELYRLISSAVAKAKQ